MIKKKYIKKFYKAFVLCDKCGAQMQKTGYIDCTLPINYEYICFKCKNKKYYSVDIDEIQFEYEEE